MAINFPTSPSLNAVHTESGLSWKYNGNAWLSVATSNTDSVVATGSTQPRSLSDRFADTVNVKDFGAKGDGTTDDTAAIQAALNSGNQNVSITSGTYLCSSELTISSNTTLNIDGVIVRSGTGTLRGFALNGDNITIKGEGEVRGPQYGGTITYVANQNAIANTVEGTFTTQLKNITIKDISISGWGASGVYGWNIKNLVCDNLKLHDIGRIGLLSLIGEDITFSNNYIYNIGPGGGGNSPFINTYGMSASSDVGYSNAPRVLNVKMLGNTVVGIENWEAYDLHGVSGAIIKENTAINCMIGLFIGPSTGTNNANTDNVVVEGNYFNNRQGSGSQYSRAGIIAAPSFGNDEYGDNIVISDNVIIGHGTNQAVYDAGFVSTDGEGSILIARTRNCIVDSNVITTPFRVGILSRAQNLGTSITNNRVDSPSQVESEAVCFKGTGSSSCIVSISNNTWQRLGGSSSAVTIDAGTSTVYGYRYVEDNVHLGSFTSIFTGSSYDNIHRQSSWRNKTLASGVVSLTGSGATLSEGFNVSTVNRNTTGVVVADFEVDAIDADYFVSVSPRNGSSTTATYNSNTSGQITFIISDAAGASTDTSFSFQITGKTKI